MFICFQAVSLPLSFSLLLLLPVHAIFFYLCFWYWCLFIYFIFFGILTQGWTMRETSEKRDARGQLPLHLLVSKMSSQVQDILCSLIVLSLLVQEYKRITTFKKHKHRAVFLYFKRRCQEKHLLSSWQADLTINPLQHQETRESLETIDSKKGLFRKVMTIKKRKKGWWEKTEQESLIP